MSAYWANLIISGTSSLWNRVIVFQRDGILSTGYFADLTIVFTKQRWKKQSTHVLKKNISSCYDCILDYTIVFQILTQERDLEVLTIKTYPKKKSTIKKVHFGLEI